MTPKKSGLLLDGNMTILIYGIGSAAMLLLAGSVRAGEMPLLDFGAAEAESRLEPDFHSRGQVTFKIIDGAKGKALEVTIPPGPASYPGVRIKPVGNGWDLSAYGRVEARVVNTGRQILGFNLRVDNAGDWRTSPWNVEQVWLKPGAAQTVSVIFGHSFGHRPAYAMKSGAVVSILVYAEKSQAPQSFRLESLVAAGSAGERPPLDPKLVRVRPTSAAILGPGAVFEVAVEIGHDTTPWKIARSGLPIPNVELQIETKGGAHGSVVGPTATLRFPEGNGEHVAAIKPTIGRWDLRAACEVCVKLKNEGNTPVTPSVQVISDGGPTDLIPAATPLAAGAEQEIVIPFIPAMAAKAASVTKPGFYGVQPGTGTSFTSDTVSAIKISARHEGESTLRVESVVADAPVAQLPDWLGKRPPVDGDWVKTFDDEFDGTAVDQKKWAIYGPNYWDGASHWSKDNVIVGGGLVKLRYEKKTGHHNDDPKEKRTDYAVGFLETYGKWVQRYGYFEARMKLPTAPGLWPAFWMAVDRGVAAGPQWKRQDTGNGGTELDIMEHLTRWGGYRYNVAMHWDGYQKDHKAVGSDRIYVQQDKDGFITCGLLWTPGSAIYYANGKEVFRWESPRVSHVPSDMMLTMPLGGWDNNRIDDTKLPADFVIDYVRVWQRKDLASNVDGYQSEAKPAAGVKTTK